MVDYTATPSAARSRFAKAERLARWAWDTGLTRGHLDLTTDPQWARLCKLAGYDRPGSERTRRLAEALLLVKEEWAAAHPTDPRARRTVLTDEAATALLNGATK
jgi:hypothetical protein